MFPAAALSLILTASPAAGDTPSADEDAPGAPGADCLRLTAQMPPDTLTLRDLWRFTLQVDVDPEWSAVDAGIPGIIIQLDVPESIHIQGPYFTTREELARNEFLQGPFERILRPGLQTKIGFHIDEIVPDIGIGINVVAYLRPAGADPDDSEAWFVHRRFELPVRGGSEAVPGDDSNDSWSGAGLEVGDVAADFSLPRADGEHVALSDYRGRTNVIVTTYRAFW